MRWREGRQSDNVEDRRGRGGPVGPGLRVGGLGGLGILLVLGVSLLTGVNPLALLELLDGGDAVVQAPGPGSPSGPAPPPGDDQGQFVSVILADTEDTWSRLFGQLGRRYEPPRLVLFSRATPSACGLGSAAMGPFYCPPDRQVYLDLSFFQELDRRFGAPGDFAQAYVIAHEVGHHVQTLLGIGQRVQQRRQQVSEREANALSVRLELQADCLAGVWGYHADRQRNLLEPGDVEEGLRAAAAIGDDVLQRRSSGQVVPESWTHGSADQRVRWLRRGMASGRIEDCDTFQTARL